MRNAVFLTFDDAYWDHARACLNSIRVNYPGYPLLLISYDGTSPAIRRWLSRLRRAELASPDRFRLSCEGFPAGPVASEMVYRRYALWGDEFSGLDSILGLDVDTLVLKPLDGLFLHDEFFAVSNHCFYDDVRVFGADRSDNPELMSLLDEDGLSYPSRADDMINAGVFLLPRRRRSRFEQEGLVSLTRRYARWLAYADQSAISLWMHRHRIRASHTYAYNLQARLLRDRGLGLKLSDAAVLHFSDRKPGDTGFRDWDDLRGYVNVLEDMFHRYRDLA